MISTERREELIRRTFALACRARQHGNHPFGALLADGDGTILLEAENTVVTELDPTGHAETNLVRLAGRELSREVLEESILFTSTEPCPMCCGAIHWAGIRQIVFGLPEDHLYRLSGSDPGNPSIRLPSRVFFTHTKRAVTIAGPLLEAEAARVHEGFWQKCR